MYIGHAIIGVTACGHAVSLHLCELCPQLQNQFPSLQSDLLPPKKAFGNTTEEFVEKRQQQLELYLQHLVHSLQPHPKELLDFLAYKLIVRVHNRVYTVTQPIHTYSL